MMIVTFGRVTKEALLAARKLQEKGIGVSVVRFFKLKGFDESRLPEIFADAKKILFVEEGMEIGSFSSYLQGVLLKKGLLDGKKVKEISIKEKFVPHGTLQELYSEVGLDRENIERELIGFAQT